ncbi:MAG: hypothetical protein D4S01_04220 [Dehalococcoidia bacterium]|nr:MAG: hypothetical protein D4S01_04220 [Dehalococcoidia bacterium]
MEKKNRRGLLKRRPIRGFLSERSTLIIEKPLLGSKNPPVKEETVERKRYGFRRLRRPEPSKEESRFAATPKSHTHLSYGGQSKLDYCVECLSKHSQTAKVLMREAIQRAQVGSPSDSGVLEKVRGAVEELVGFEDDSDTVKNEKVAELNSSARLLRKYIYGKGAEVGTASLEDLQEIKGLIDGLVDVTYQVRASEECIGCTVESVCGANVECVEFVQKALKGVKDPNQIRKILREARTKYGSD